MFTITGDIGALIRWLLKGCKTKLKDEVNGNLEATWGRSYGIENYIIGVISLLILWGIVIFVLELTQ